MYPNSLCVMVCVCMHASRLLCLQLTYTLNIFLGGGIWWYTVCLYGVLCMSTAYTVHAVERGIGTGLVMRVTHSAQAHVELIVCRYT